MRILAAILAMASAGTTLTVSTVAALAQESRQLIVEHDDLKLSAPGGRAALDGGLRTAARRVCGPIPAKPVHKVPKVRDCNGAAKAPAWYRISAAAAAAVAGHRRLR
jgi:UrcA family protein